MATAPVAALVVLSEDSIGTTWTGHLVEQSGS